MNTRTRHRLLIVLTVCIVAGGIAFLATRNGEETPGFPITLKVVEDLGGRMKVYDLVDAGIADPGVREKATSAAFTSLYARGGEPGVTVLNVSPEGSKGQPRAMEFRGLRAIPIPAEKPGDDSVRYSTGFRLVSDGYRERGGVWRRGTPEFLDRCRLTVHAVGMKHLSWVQVVAVATDPPLLLRNPAQL